MQKKLLSFEQRFAPVDDATPRPTTYTRQRRRRRMQKTAWKAPAA